jgi:phosphoserine aminotransferase
MGVMEMSHRGKEFMGIAAQAEKPTCANCWRCRPNYKVLFMQGGATRERDHADEPDAAAGGGRLRGHRFVVAEVAARRRASTAEVNIAASVRGGRNFTTVPAQADWRLSADPAYVFTCTNETIGGVEYQLEPDLAQIGRGDVPLVATCLLAHPVAVIDVSRYGLIFAGAQKNIGPAGLTIVIVREDLLGRAQMPHCPTAFDYKTVADNGSM